MSPDQFAQAVVEGGQVPMLVGEVARGKALAVVVEAATVKDTNGEVVDLDDEEDETESATEVVAEVTDGDEASAEASEEKPEA
jgi:trigger factor